MEVLVKNYQSTSQLASFLVVLRRDYDTLKASKAAVRKEKDKLAQEITYLKRKVRENNVPIFWHKFRRFCVTPFAVFPGAEQGGGAAVDSLSALHDRDRPPRS